MLEMGKSCLDYVSEFHTPPNAHKLGPLEMILEASMGILSYQGNSNGGRLDSDLKNEGTRAANKILEICEEGGPLVADRTLKDPPLMFHTMIAEFDADYKLAIEYTKKLKQYRIERGDRDGVQSCDAKIMSMKRKMGHKPSKGENEKMVAESLVRFRRDFEKIVEVGEEDTQHGILQAIQLGDAQRANYMFIQAQRLLTTILERSRRVLGLDHQITIDAEKSLKRAKMRIVGYKGDKRSGFNALSYDDSLGLYEIKGPVTSLDGRNEKIIMVPGDKIWFGPGTPVICHGLQNATYNGELGETVGKMDHSTMRYKVKFDNGSLQTANIRAINLRIAFSIPDKEDWRKEAA